MNRKLLLLSLLLTMLFCPVGAESYQTFSNISLPADASQVNVVFQDERGMVWFGARRGLCSYNGYNLHERPDAAHPDGNSVFAILQYDDDRICIGTDNGIRWFNLRTESYENIFPELESVGAVRSLVLHDGYLWIGTRDEGLKRYDFSTGNIEDMTSDGKEKTTVYYLESVGERLFIASYEHLTCYDAGTDSMSVIELGTPGRLMVNSLLWDENHDCLWVGTEGYLYKYFIATGEAVRQPFLIGNSFKTLSFDGDGNILMGTDAGLYVLDRKRGTRQHIVHDSRNPNSLCNNVIWDILCDRHQNIWLATDRGVSLAHRNAGRRYMHISEIVRSGDGNLFTYMLRDTYGDWWLGGENGLIHIRGGLLDGDVGWFRHDNGERRLRHNRVRHIYEDSSAGIWIATDGGVGRYDRRSDRFIFYRIQTGPSGKNANWAYSIAEDSQGRIWVASYMGGVFVCDRDSMEILHHLDESDGIGNNVYHLQADEEGHIWASSSKGLVSIDENTLEFDVHDVYMDNMLYADDHIWYSLSGKLYRYDVSDSEQINIPFSENCRQIYSFIREDEDIWFTSSDGVFRIDTETLSVTDMFHTSEPYLCGLHDRRSGEMILGGEDAVMTFTLEDRKPRCRQDTLFIASLVSGEGLMKPGDDYEIGEGRLEIRNVPDFTIELSSYSYRPDESYWYRFDDGPWQTTGRNRNHIPVDLPGGTYTLQLSCSDPDSVQDAGITTCVVVIPHPWYIDWKAFVLYFAVLAAVAAVVLKARIRRKERDEQMKEKEKFLNLFVIENLQKHKPEDKVFLEKVTEAIEKNMGREEFNVSLLADMMAVDNKQLYRKLKQLTGLTPVNYIRKLRMRKAAVLLEQEKFTVSEVMYLVGYSNSSYFSKCFAEEFGSTPKGYAATKRTMSD